LEQSLAEFPAMQFQPASLWAQEHFRPDLETLSTAISSLEDGETTQAFTDRDTKPWGSDLEQQPTGASLLEEGETAKTSSDGGLGRTSAEIISWEDGEIAEASPDGDTEPWDTLSRTGAHHFSRHFTDVIDPREDRQCIPRVSYRCGLPASFHMIAAQPRQADHPPSF